MLGELIGECSGHIGGFRVMNTEDGTALEVTLRGEGRLLGEPIADFGTLVQPVRSGRPPRGNAHHVMMTASGDIGDWSGFGVGRPTGSGFQSSWAAYGHFEAPQGTLSRLADIVTTIEFDVDEDGSYRWRMWEWTNAGALAAVR